MEEPERVARESIRDLVGDQVRIEFVPERAGDFGGKEISAEKAIRELGWERSVDFKEGLERTVDWFCEKWGHPRSVGGEPRRG